MPSVCGSGLPILPAGPQGFSHPALLWMLLDASGFFLPQTPPLPPRPAPIFGQNVLHRHLVPSGPSVLRLLLPLRVRRALQVSVCPALLFSILCPRFCPLKCFGQFVLLCCLKPIVCLLHWNRSFPKSRGFPVLLTLVLCYNCNI